MRKIIKLIVFLNFALLYLKGIILFLVTYGFIVVADLIVLVIAGIVSLIGAYFMMYILKWTFSSEEDDENKSEE